MSADAQHTAFHEAGHAVIGRVLGMACGQVTIVPDHDSSGHSITSNPSDTYELWEERGKFRGDEMHSIYVGRILTLMAGAEAERELLGRCNGGESDDLKQIEKVAASSDGFPSHDKWKRYEPRMRRQVRDLVCWENITIETHLLGQYKILTVSPSLLAIVAMIGNHAISEWIDVADCNVHSTLILPETTLANGVLPFWVWVSACVEVEEGGGF